MTSESINTYQVSIELVERFAECLLKYCKTRDDLSSVKQLGSFITHFSNEIDMNYKGDEIFENFVNSINSSTEKPDTDSVLKQFNKEIDKAKIEINRSKMCKKYYNFMKMISEHNLACGSDDSDDDEIRTVLETVNTIDPISKLPILEPVKNKICGHTYEKSTILQLIKQNPKTRCPIVGCDATGYVKKDNLVPDNLLKRMLSKTNSNSQKKFRPS